MTRCTVCGATSREGARFCTSCGTRLEDDQNGAEPDASIATPAPTESIATVNEPPEPDTSDAQPPEPDRYISSWPSATNASPAEPVETPESGIAPATKSSPEEVPSSNSENGVASWPAPAAAERTPGEEAGSRSPDAGDAPAVSSSTEWSAPVSAPPDTSGKAGTTHSAQFERLHQLLDEMQQRIERISNPATLASRNLNPDDLADQIERWSRAVPDTDSLLEAVRQVRRSPRDIDALRQLADRIADLELLVQHYQSITSTSSQWATDLRRLRDKPTTS